MSAGRLARPLASRVGREGGEYICEETTIFLMMISKALRIILTVFVVASLLVPAVAADDDGANLTIILEEDLKSTPRTDVMENQTNLTKDQKAGGVDAWEEQVRALRLQGKWPPPSGFHYVDKSKILQSNTFFDKMIDAMWEAIFRSPPVLGPMGGPCIWGSR